MKSKLKYLPPFLIVIWICFFVVWHWQATYAEGLVLIRIPQWIIGGGDTSYSIAVGKSQIKPYGTVWKKTIGEDCIWNYPIYTEEDLARYEKRHKTKSNPTPLRHGGDRL